MRNIFTLSSFLILLSISINSQVDNNIEKSEHLLKQSLVIIDSSESKSYSKNNIWKEIASDSKIFINDGMRFYSTPFRLNVKEWGFTGFGLISLGIIATQDKNFKDKFSKSEKQYGFWRYITDYGDVKFAGIGSAILYLTGLFSNENSIRETGRMLLQSLVYSGGITIILKTATGRSRPYSGENQYDFGGFETEDEDHSFPSGHSTVAFAVSTVLAEKINTWWSRAGFYSIAALTAYSRVHNNKHWVSDIIAGSLIGFGAGYFVVNKNEKRSFSLSPSLNGFVIQYKF